MTPFLSGAIKAGKTEAQSFSEPQKAGQTPESEVQPAKATPAVNSDDEDVSATDSDTSKNEINSTASESEETPTKAENQAVEPISTPSATPMQEPATAPISIQEPAIEEDNTAYEELIPDEYKGLPYYYAENAKRYVKYIEQNPDIGHDKAILNVNIGIDNPFYSNIKSITEPGSIDTIVNKYHKLPDNFKPKLEELPASLCAEGVGKQYLRSNAKAAFENMHRDAKELGLNITAFGTYRSIQLQHDIWNGKVNSGRSIEDVDKLNSRGGHSEHHTGLAIDVIRNGYAVESTKEFEWYKDNAHRYGFIIRYPKGKEQITGYQYEPWHLRYLGVDLAKAVYESDLTYEEYYATYIEPN